MIVGVNMSDKTNWIQKSTFGHLFLFKMQVFALTKSWLVLLGL